MMFGLGNPFSSVLPLLEQIIGVPGEEAKSQSWAAYFSSYSVPSRDVAQAPPERWPLNTSPASFIRDQESSASANAPIPFSPELDQGVPSSGSAAPPDAPQCVIHTTPTVPIPDAHSRGHGPSASVNTPTHPSLVSYEKDPWLRKSLLSLDGGGVRGYSSLLILKALMMKIKELEEKSGAPNSVSPLAPRTRRRVQILTRRKKIARDSPDTGVEQWTPLDPYLPCHYFDYIAGTSTGGLISIMLGRLSMTVDECLDAYETLSDRVFGSPRWFYFLNTVILNTRDKYDPKVLDQVIREIIKQRDSRGQTSTKLQQPNEDMCRTMMIAWKENDTIVERQPYIFRSYFHPNMGRIAKQRNPEGDTSCELRLVARATSAAPLYFHSVIMEENDPKSALIDGGLGANNPSEEAWESIKQLDRGDPKTVDINVSLGTGRMLDSTSKKPPKRGIKKKISFFYSMARMVTDTYSTHENMAQRSQDHGFHYHRLNVLNGVGNIKLDAWKGKEGEKTLKELRAKTEEYLKSSDIQNELVEIAKYLCEKRWKRSSQPDQDHWERYCHGVEYHCCIEQCNDHGKRYRERRDLRRHIQEMHRSCHNIEMWLDRGKRFPDENMVD